MPAIRSTRTKESSSSGRASNVCLECGKVLSRASDVPRHMRCHDTAKRLPCPLDGCNFKTLQKSNLETHIRTHTQEKFVCKDDPHCSFECCDPSSLLRHRKRFHNYIPKTISKPSKALTRHESKMVSSPTTESPGEPSSSLIPPHLMPAPIDDPIQHSFSAENFCGLELCSPVMAGNLGLDVGVASGLNSHLNSGIAENIDVALVDSFNSIINPSLELAELQLHAPSNRVETDNGLFLPYCCQVNPISSVDQSVRVLGYEYWRNSNSFVNFQYR